MKPQPEWQPGTFLDNLNVAALHVGYENLPLAWGIASVPWKSVEDRDSFLTALTKTIGQ